MSHTFFYAIRVIFGWCPKECVKIYFLVFKLNAEEFFPHRIIIITESFILKLPKEEVQVKSNIFRIKFILFLIKCHTYLIFTLWILWNKRQHAKMPKILRTTLTHGLFQGALKALFLNPESWSSSHDSWFKCQQTKKQYNTRATHFTGIVYLKQRQEDILSLVFKKLNPCPLMQASCGVNSLATSHTVEHLSSICLHSWSHDKPILYLIYHCLTKIDIAWNLWYQKKRFFILQKSNLLEAISWRCDITRYKLKIYAAPSRGRKIQLSYTVLGPC